MAGFALIPKDDPKQALRIRRYLLAAGTSFLVLVLMYLLYWQGYLERTGLIRAGAAILFFCALFYALFRSGLNLKTSDPSLTSAQMVSAILVLTYAMFYTSSDARGLILLLFLVAFLFGVFRLGTRELIAVALIAILCYGLMVGALARFRPETADMRLELLRWGVVAAVLLWFAVVGGYISRLRKQLTSGNARLENALRTIQEISTHDELTGVPNRRYLMDMLRQETARSARTGAPFCVCLADIDFFKSVNDRLGHAAGDEVLRGFARSALKETRATDHFGRYGGEEFMLILTQTTLASARIRAGACEALRKRSDFPILPPTFA